MLGSENYTKARYFIIGGARRQFLYNHGTTCIIRYGGRQETVLIKSRKGRILHCQMQRSLQSYILWVGLWKPTKMGAVKGETGFGQPVLLVVSPHPQFLLFGRTDNCCLTNYVYFVCSDPKANYFLGDKSNLTS